MYNNKHINNIFSVLPKYNTSSNTENGSFTENTNNFTFTENKIENNTFTETNIITENNVTHKKYENDDVTSCNKIIETNDCKSVKDDINKNVNSSWFEMMEEEINVVKSVESKKLNDLEPDTLINKVEITKESKTIHDINQRNKERYYKIQRNYNDIPKSAKTMICVGIDLYERNGWMLRRYKTIVSEDMLDIDIKELKDTFKEVLYLKVNNEKTANHYIVYIKKR